MKILAINFYLLILISSYLAATIEVTGFSDPSVRHLREVGKASLDSKDYVRAAQYYSAIIQALENDNGSESEDLRRRCYLTLAECEIQNGNLFHAIARCSDILNECPDPSVAIKNLSSARPSDIKGMWFLHNVMSKALYRRGISLLKLNKPHLAVIDLNTSLHLKPNDSRIQEQFDLAKKKSKQKVGSATNIGEELADLVEECQVNYPRMTLSRSQMDTLISSDKSQRQRSLTLSTSDRRPSPFADQGSLSDIFGGMGMGMGADGGGLAGFPGLSGEGSGGLSGVLSLLSTFGIVDTVTAKRLEKLLVVWTKVQTTFAKVRSEVSKRRNLIIMAMNLLIVLATFLMYSK